MLDGFAYDDIWQQCQDEQNRHRPQNGSHLHPQACSHNPGSGPNACCCSQSSRALLCGADDDGAGTQETDALNHTCMTRDMSPTPMPACIGPIMNNALPTATSIWVLTPAVLDFHSRSNPIMAQQRGKQQSQRNAHRISWVTTLKIQQR
ncbi:MAG: hypothetical protein R3D67_18865 [Hyphomicrobiaceae bacterium]